MSFNNNEKQVKSQIKSLQNMDEVPGVFLVWKQQGETLAVLLRRFRHEEGLSEEVKITYAGRLDPMAEGIVPLLVGDARFQKERFMHKRKTYDVAVLLGAHTDTGDMLGMVTDTRDATKNEEEIQHGVASLTSITKLPYPLYSSRPVDGVPLFVHARKGTAVTVPTKHVTIYNAHYKGSKERLLSECLAETLPIIAAVTGDFRQAECAQSWNAFLAQNSNRSIVLVEMSIECSSGAYMRTLAEMLGERLGVPALAYRIVRTKVGE